MSKADKLLREATTAVELVAYAHRASGLPVDICASTALVMLHAGRQLGYRTRALPVRIGVHGPDGQEGRHLGYDFDLIAQLEGRYNGHVIALWEEQIVLDPTAPQMDKAIPSLCFPVPRSFGKGEPYTLELDSGWRLTYTPFDDHGDWIRGPESTGEAHREARSSGQALAAQVRPRRV